MIDNLFQIEKSQIEENVNKMLEEGYRFITMTCVDMGENFDIFYHFAKEYNMKNFKIELKKDEELESISKVYFSALLVENEIKDLFGVKVKNIAIDYNGRLLLSEGAPLSPMCNTGQIEIEVRGKNDGK